MTKDEHPSDENQSSLEDFFTQSDTASEDTKVDSDDAPSSTGTNSSNEGNPNTPPEKETPTDSVVENGNESPREVVVGESDTP